ncbi:MAG: glycosyltransferase family 4 protein [Candidatus Marinimicrobia bacterium]|nr:glycosyltransferase family 4 protein [Candidatus Neomarinimicrobiota bacterium]
MKEKIKKVLIAHQSTIPHYRVALYQKMEELKPKEWEFSVIFDDDKLAHDKFFKESVVAEDFNFQIEKATTYNRQFFNRSITYQSFILRAWKYDLIIIGNTINNISYLIGFLYAIFGKSVAVWWHRHNFSKGNLHGMRNLRENFLLWASKRSKGVFTYTAGVKEYLHEQGLDNEKLFVLSNTIDINEKRRSFNNLQSRRDELRESFNLSDKKSLLFVGRLNTAKRLDFLAESFNRLKKKDASYHLSIIGGGDDSIVRHLIDTFGSESVAYHGVLTETDHLSQHYIASDLFVYPGDVGLGPLHSLCFNLPALVIDSDSHGPEFEYLNEHNSVIMPRDTTNEDFANKIEELLLNDAKLKQLRSGAWDSIKHLTIDNMAKSFIEGINSILST